MRPGTDLLVRVEAGLDLDTGLLEWRFDSIDPLTGRSTEDPLAGFLPPNVRRCSSDPTVICDDSSPCSSGDCIGKGEGEGSVLFTVLPRSGLPTGTVISSQAEIVFDIEQGMRTDACPGESPHEPCPWTNAIDGSSPVSHVLPLAPGQMASLFQVRWEGTDEGSGIVSYTVLVSEDGGPFELWFERTTITTAEFEGQVGKAYSFYSIARDAVGNQEEAPPSPDASTRVESHFRRGDSNGDGEINITDVINVLNFLFLGGDPLNCQDAGDANDDGAVNITDVIAILFFLFLDPDALAAPGKDCGSDLIEDGLPPCVYDRC